MSSVDRRTVSCEEGSTISNAWNRSDVRLSGQLCFEIRDGVLQLACKVHDHSAGGAAIFSGGDEYLPYAEVTLCEAREPLVSTWPYSIELSRTRVFDWPSVWMVFAYDGLGGECCFIPDATPRLTRLEAERDAQRLALDLRRDQLQSYEGRVAETRAYVRRDLAKVRGMDSDEESDDDFRTELNQRVELELKEKLTHNGHYYDDDSWEIIAYMAVNDSILRFLRKRLGNIDEDLVESIANLQSLSARTLLLLTCGSLNRIGIPVSVQKLILCFAFTRRAGCAPRVQ